MSLSKIMGAILILISLGVGYIGVNKLVDSTKEVSFIGITIDASSEKGQQQGSIYLGIAVLLFAGGIYSITRPKKG